MDCPVLNIYLRLPLCRMDSFHFLSQHGLPDIAWFLSWWLWPHFIPGTALGILAPDHECMTDHTWSGDWFRRAGHLDVPLQCFGAVPYLPIVALKFGIAQSRVVISWGPGWFLELIGGSFVGEGWPSSPCGTASYFFLPWFRWACFINGGLVEVSLYRGGFFLCRMRWRSIYWCHVLLCCHSVAVALIGFFLVCLVFCFWVFSHFHNAVGLQCRP